MRRRLLSMFLWLTDILVGLWSCYAFRIVKPIALKNEWGWLCRLIVRFSHSIVLNFRQDEYQRLPEETATNVCFPGSHRFVWKSPILQEFAICFRNIEFYENGKKKRRLPDKTMISRRKDHFVKNRRLFEQPFLFVVFSRSCFFSQFLPELIVSPILMSSNCQDD